MNNKVIIIGAGGHGKVIADIIIKSGDIIKGFLDDRFPDKKDFIGYPILGKIKDYRKEADAKFIIAIGNAAVRESIVKSSPSVEWYTAVHPTATLSDIDVQIGVGSVIMANAVINPSAHIGNHCIVNSSSVIEHDNCISDFVHISVGAKLAGTVSVGKRSWVGIGAVVSNNLSICEDCMIGAGAVVVKDIDKPGTYIGIPAKEKDSNEKKCMDF